MNLRDKFIWNVLIGLAFLAIGWYGWELFNNNSRMKKLEVNYKEKEKEEESEVLAQVTELEEKYKSRSNKFINNENPFDLTRALLGGSESGGSKKLLCNSTTFVNGKYKASIKYKGSNLIAVEGEEYEWGKILEVNEYEVIYIKNGIKKSLGNTSFKARIK